MAITGKYGRFVCDTDDERLSLTTSGSDVEGWECLVKTVPSRFYKFIDGDWQLIGGVVVSAVTNIFPPYSGADALKFLRLSSGGVDLEFVTLVGGGDMLAANNLADVADVSVAVDNLGINDLISDAYNLLDASKEDVGVAATLASAAESNANDYTDAEIVELKDGVATEGDTLQKLYNLITAGLAEVTVANIAARDAYNIPTLPYHIFVTDDGDGNWALYKATTTGVGATYVKLSDPDLLNAVMSNAAIKAAYEANADTNAFTNALLSKLNGIASGATANATNVDLRDRSTHTGTQVAATISDFNAAAAAAAPPETVNTVGALVNGSASATPNDSDYVATVETSVLKKITWSNVKAFLKTYFDTTYTAKNGVITGATKTKITYDAKGLVTAGADATQDDIGDGSSFKQYSAADKAKVGFLTITQSVDLDDIETRVNNLDAAVVLKGTWDATSGVFPGAGAAQAGASYIVSVAGTVNGVSFAVGDRIIAILDNASTVTFLNNWFKADYTDQVLSVNGQTGAVVLTTANVAASTDKNYVTDAQAIVIGNTSGTNSGNETTTTVGTLINAATAKTTPVDADFIGLMDSAASNILKKLSWANVKATLKTYFDTIYTTTASVATQITTALSSYATLASPNFTGTPTFASGINANEYAHGIFAGNTAEQSQIVVSGTNYYITGSNINLPLPVKAGMKVGTKFTWRVFMTKTAAGTGIFQISMYRGTNGTTADTQDVLQTIGTQTAVVDTMELYVTLTVTAIGPTGSYYWTICPMCKAATATGFGVVVGTGGLFSGSVAGVAMNTDSLKFGLGFKATTGTPTIRVVQVHARAYNMS